MKYRKGKYVHIDQSAPRALGVCDTSGFIFNRNDLVRQMEWRGNALVWTGFYVGRPFLDEPNQQGRPPMFPPDPLPIKEPRPRQGQVNTWQQNPYFWDKYGGSWDIPDESHDGVMELPYTQNLAQLNSVNWGTGT